MLRDGLSFGARQKKQRDVLVKELLALHSRGGSRTFNAGGSRC